MTTKPLFINLTLKQDGSGSEATVPSLIWSELMDIAAQHGLDARLSADRDIEEADRISATEAQAIADSLQDFLDENPVTPMTISVEKTIQFCREGAFVVRGTIPDQEPRMTTATESEAMHEPIEDLDQ